MRRTFVQPNGQSKILVINAGSSSLKYALFSITKHRGRTKKNQLKALHRGHFDNHGEAINDFNAAVNNAIATMRNAGALGTEDEITVVGHRVVHGGERYIKPIKITPAVLSEIEALSSLAPLHNPPNIAAMKACMKLFSTALHGAVFDTAFHHTMPKKAYLYALPYELYEKHGIRRYGFHGTSHQYVFEQAREKLGVKRTRRTITCHLGNGCSIAAIKDGRVIDTSMGFTPLEGVPMGTRSGDVDPAIIFHLEKSGMSGTEVEELLNKKSGLRGVSALSSDVRDLWAAYQKGDARAIRALELFSYRVAKYCGAYASGLGGIDCIVFTGGIGEHAGYVRGWILAYLKHFKNKKVLVIPTDEEMKIAEAVAKL